MQNIRLVLAAVAALALAACYPPTTSHPVGSTVGFKGDPSLVGLWKARSTDPDNHTFYYYHLLHAKDGSMLALLVPGNGGEASDVMMFKLKTARFGNFGFLNARAMMDPEHEATDQPPGSVPVLYRFEANGTLKIFILEEDATKNAIRAHKIAGTVGTSETDDAVITADGATLDNFFRGRTGLALFEKPFAILTKVK
jgi:hypothetical protein